MPTADFSAKLMRQITSLLMVGSVAGGIVCAGLVGAAQAQDDNANALFRQGAQAYVDGDKNKAVHALQFAADKGHVAAQWKLGKMYGAGDGVELDAKKAYAYFRKLVETHAEESPTSPQARIVSNAFITLGGMYRSGHKPAGVTQDLPRARQLFTHAASYFGDPEAQYQLAKFYIDGQGVDKDPKTAARWLHLAAKKNHALAQYQLGRMLSFGEGVRRHPAQGLMWLSKARESLFGTEREAVLQAHDDAMFAATEEERNKARALLALQKLEK